MGLHAGQGHSPSSLPPGLGSLRGLGLVYFLYLFLFSGLEFTLSFLVYPALPVQQVGRPNSADPHLGTRVPGPQSRSLGGLLCSGVTGTEAQAAWPCEGSTGRAGC